MAAAAFTITRHREAVIDFTTPYMQDSMGILTPASDENQGDIFQLFKPFHWHVWVGIGALMLIVGLVLCILNNISPFSEWRVQRNKQERTEEISFRENMFLAISSVLEQGPTYHPRVTSARCFLGFWFVFSILIMSMYTAHLAAVLTVSTPVIQINSLQDLAQHDDMKVLVSYGTNTWTLFEKSNIDIYMKVKEKMQPPDSYSEGIELVKTRKYSLIADRSPMEYVAVQSCGKLRMAEERFQSGSYGLVLPANAAYKDAIDYNILKMVESGMIGRWKLKWLHHATSCTDPSSGEKALSLSMDRLGGLFVVYCGMIVIATVSLLVELSIKIL